MTTDDCSYIEHLELEARVSELEGKLVSWLKEQERWKKIDAQRVDEICSLTERVTYLESLLKDARSCLDLAFMDSTVVADKIDTLFPYKPAPHIQGMLDRLTELHAEADAAAVTRQDYSTDTAIQNKLNSETTAQDGCPHCAKEAANPNSLVNRLTPKVSTQDKPAARFAAKCDELLHRVNEVSTQDKYVEGCEDCGATKPIGCVCWLREESSNDSETKETE
jgi:hypothetical protein